MSLPDRWNGRLLTSLASERLRWLLHQTDVGASLRAAVVGELDRRRRNGHVDPVVPHRVALQVLARIESLAESR